MHAASSGCTYKPGLSLVCCPACLQLNVTVSNHLRDLPNLTNSIKYEVITDATRDALTGAWKVWMEETREQGGGCLGGGGLCG
jgi:hypothetical protein